MTDATKLRTLLTEIYDRRGDEARISPSWLANEAMVTMDPKRKTPTLIYTAAHLQLRQVARLVLRQRFEDGGEETEQHSLFPELQRRYPAAHTSDAEPEYVLLEHLTEADVEFNVKRLSAEAESKQRHSDALKAWWKKQGRGKGRRKAAAA